MKPHGGYKPWVPREQWKWCCAYNTAFGSRRQSRTGEKAAWQREVDEEKTGPGISSARTPCRTPIRKEVSRRPGR